MSRRNRKLKNYLLNRRFQLKYTGMVVAIGIALSVALGFFLHRQMMENTRILRLEAEFDPVFKAQLDQADSQNLAMLVGTLVLFNVALALGSIFVTHRMAGPEFVLNRYVRMVAAGKLPVVRELRRGDELVDLHDGVRAMVARLETQTLDDIQVLEKALAGLEDAEARGAVQQALERKRRAVAKEPSVPPDGGAVPSLDAQGMEA